MIPLIETAKYPPIHPHIADGTVLRNDGDFAKPRKMIAS